MNKLICSLTVVTLITLGMAQDTSTDDGMSFSDFDTPGNGQVDVTQFSTGLTNGGLFTAMDADSSGTIDQSELAQGICMSLDSSGMGLTQQDFDSGLDLWMGSGNMSSSSDTDSTVASPVVADTDGDGQVSQDECGQALSTNSSLIAHFDSDGEGSFTEDDFNRGVFSLVDSNGDLSVDETEFDAASVFFGRHTTTEE
jgi:Ca2+-binding EF-hand superfamily protein